MGKVNVNRMDLKKSWITELDLRTIFYLDGSTFVCQVKSLKSNVFHSYTLLNSTITLQACTKGYNFSQKSELRQHCGTASHNKSLQQVIARPERQQIIDGSLETINRFHMDMAEAFLCPGSSRCVLCDV